MIINVNYKECSFCFYKSFFDYDDNNIYFFSNDYIFICTKCINICNKIFYNFLFDSYNYFLFENFFIKNKDLDIFINNLLFFFNDFFLFRFIYELIYYSVIFSYYFIYIKKIYFYIFNFECRFCGFCIYFYSYFYNLIPLYSFNYTNFCLYCYFIFYDIENYLYYENNIINIIFKFINLNLFFINDHYKNNNLFKYLIKPYQIYNYLSKYIIGQSDSLKKISYSIHNHLKNIKLNNFCDFNFKKNNVLIVGPSGSGKTYIFDILSKILNIPLIIIDATSLTESGYVGDDVDSILYKLYQKSFYNIYFTEIGIVYIDEIDKINKKKSDFSNKDISGEGVQQSLLKMLEGNIYDICTSGNKKNLNSSYVKINSKNILFFCGGSFEDILKKYISFNDNFSNNFIGILNKNKKIFIKHDFSKDFLFFNELINFGMIPEFINRFSLIINLVKLSKKSLINILLYSKNSLLNYYNMILNISNIFLFLDKRAAEIICNKVFINLSGVRGLKNIIDNILFNIFFEFSENLKKIIINKYVFINFKKPYLVYNI